MFSDDLINTIFIVIIFFGLVLCALQKRTSLIAKILLVFLSFLEGFLISLFSQKSLVDFFLFTSIFALIIYEGAQHLPDLVIHFKQKKFGEMIPYSNTDLTQKISKIWNYPIEKIHFSIYPGSDSDNAKIIALNDTIDIYIGEKYMEGMNSNQLLFTIAHEISHKGQNRGIYLFGVIFALYSFFTYILFNNMTYPEFDILALLLIGFLIFIIGIMALNYSSWLDEYEADERGFLKVGTLLNEAVSLIMTFKKNQQNDGIIANLIFYTHPNLEYRIEKLKKLS